MNPPDGTIVMASRYEIGKQPCQNLKRGEGSLPGVNNEHQCPICWGIRTWCDNCYCDHHEGGWETCKPEAYRKNDDDQ